MADILIIGGGVSGLSAGIYAQMLGHRAVICEKLPTAGGNLTGWKRGEFQIDNCIHWLTGTNPSSSLYKMWEDLGALGDNIPVYRPESLFTCEHEGQTLSLWRDLDRLERDLLALSPQDKKEIRRMMRAVRTLQAFCEVGGPRKNKSLSLGAILSGGPAILRDYRLTTKQLADRFRHPLIKVFLTSLISEQFASLAFLFVVAHFCGGNADLPAGGSIPMANRMVARFRDLGGELLPNKEALQILREDDRAVGVLFSDGTSAAADEILITIDPAVAFPKLLGMPVAKAFAAKYHHPRLFRFSSFHGAFACDLSSLPFRGDFTWQLPAPLAFRLGSQTILLREFSHDPASAPPGKTLLQVMVPCGEDAARRLIAAHADKAAYARRKQYLAEWMTRAVLEEFPVLRDHIFCIDVWTPATYRRFVGSEIGSFMGFAFGAKVLPTRVDGRVPGFSNLTFACQWQRAPGGLPIAAESGKLAAQAIAKKYRLLDSPQMEKEKEFLRQAAR